MRTGLGKILAVMGLVVTSLAAGQTMPAAAGGAAGAVGDGEIAGLLRQLENGATREGAAARLMQVTPKQLAALYETLDGRSASEGLKKELVELLPKICAKVAEEDRAEEARRAAAARAGFVEEYLKFGARGAKWDDLVVQAYQSLGAADDPVGIQATAKFKAALDAGCTDPVVRYYYVTRALFGGNLTLDDAIPELDKTTREVDASAYRALRKFYVNIRFANLAGDKALVKKVPPERITEAVDHAVAQFADMVQEPQTIATLVEAVRSIVAATPEADVKRRDAILERMTAALADSAAPSAAACALAAEYRKNWAWDARGRGFANTVTDGGWKLFDERIRLAEEAARKGWGLDPCIAANPIQMIWVCIAKSEDRPEMEKWYRRAMFANPDSYDACEGKLNYLFPKWHGSAAEALAFGRECVKNGTPGNRIPYILITAHKDLCAYGTVPNAPTAQDRERYYQQPDVWADVQSAYEKLLSDKTMLPSNRAQYLRDRGAYFKLASDTKHYQAMVKLADEFGDELDKSGLGADYLSMVNDARRQAGLLPVATLTPATPAAALPRVSYHGRGATLASVTAALDGQLGGKGLLEAVSSLVSPQAVYSFDGDQVALWDVVARLEAIKPFGLASPRNDRGRVTLDDYGPRVLASRVTGNVLLLVHPMVKDARYQNRPTLRLTMAIDPRTPVLSWEAILRDVWDDQKHVLSPIGLDRGNPGNNAFVASIPLDRADPGTKFSFALSLKYKTAVSMFSATIDDPQSHLHEPIAIGRRSVTLTTITTNLGNVYLSYTADFHDRPATGPASPAAAAAPPDEITGRLFDGNGRQIGVFPMDPAEEGHAHTIPVFGGGARGPFRLVLEYPDQVREETANFSLGDIPVVMEDTAATRRVFIVTPTSTGQSIRMGVTTEPAPTTRVNATRPATRWLTTRPARNPAPPATTNDGDMP
jgi:hypothetical protein